MTYTPEQEDALRLLAEALEAFQHGLAACEASGLGVVDSLRGCGISVPPWAAPMVNRMSLGDLHPADTSVLSE